MQVRCAIGEQMLKPNTDLLHFFWFAVCLLWKTIQREPVHTGCGLLFMLPFVELSEMICLDPVLRELPRRLQVFLCLVKIAHSEVYPTQGIPECSQATGVRQVFD